MYERKKKSQCGKFLSLSPSSIGSLKAQPWGQCGHWHMLGWSDFPLSTHTQRWGPKCVPHSWLGLPHLLFMSQPFFFWLRFIVFVFPLLTSCSPTVIYLFCKQGILLIFLSCLPFFFFFFFFFFTFSSMLLWNSWSYYTIGAEGSTGLSHHTE